MVIFREGFSCKIISWIYYNFVLVFSAAAFPISFSIDHTCMMTCRQPVAFNSYTDYQSDQQGAKFN